MLTTSRSGGLPKPTTPLIWSVRTMLLTLAPPVFVTTIVYRIWLPDWTGSGLSTFVIVSGPGRGDRDERPRHRRPAGARIRDAAARRLRIDDRRVDRPNMSNPSPAPMAQHSAYAYALSDKTTESRCPHGHRPSAWRAGHGGHGQTPNQVAMTVAQTEPPSPNPSSPRSPKRSPHSIRLVGCRLARSRTGTDVGRVETVSIDSVRTGVNTRDFRAGPVVPPCRLPDITAGGGSGAARCACGCSA